MGVPAFFFASLTGAIVPFFISSQLYSRPITLGSIVANTLRPASAHFWAQHPLQCLTASNQHLVAGSPDVHSLIHFSQPPGLRWQGNSLTGHNAAIEQPQATIRPGGQPVGVEESR